MANFSKNQKMFREGEVKFSIYGGEFARFYENHKKLCDQISGLKIKSLYNPLGNVNITINQDNFLEAIQSLSGFFSDVSHYMDILQRKILRSKIDDLEEEYLKDEIYANLLTKKKDLSSSQRLEKDKLYLNYLTKSLKVASEIFESLQKSMAVTTSDIVKMIRYENFDEFYSQLTAYRNEMIDSISHFSYKDMLSNIKKTMGYYYTYSYLIGKREKFWIEELFKILIDYYNEEETVRNIIQIEENELSESKRKELKQLSADIKSILEKIYFLCNYSLSQKNILIKTSEKVLIDKSLV